MTSLRQRNSNRRNALRSTGPRSAAGKISASKNARKHGLSQPLDVTEVAAPLAQIQHILRASGYGEGQAYRIALCILDYERVKRAEGELAYRLDCLDAVRAVLDPRRDDYSGPVEPQTPDDTHTAILAFFSCAFGLDGGIHKLPPGGADEFWHKVTSRRQFERSRKRSLNQLLKAFRVLKAQNDDYKV